MFSFFSADSTQQLTPARQYANTIGSFEKELGFTCVDIIKPQERSGLAIYIAELARVYQNPQNASYHIIYFPGKDNDELPTPAKTETPLHLILKEADKIIGNKHPNAKPYMTVCGYLDKWILESTHFTGINKINEELVVVNPKGFWSDPDMDYLRQYCFPKTDLKLVVTESQPWDDRITCGYQVSAVHKLNAAGHDTTKAYEKFPPSYELSDIDKIIQKLDSNRISLNHNNGGASDSVKPEDNDNGIISLDTESSDDFDVDKWVYVDDELKFEKEGDDEFGFEDDLIELGTGWQEVEKGPLILLNGKPVCIEEVIQDQFNTYNNPSFPLKKRTFSRDTIGQLQNQILNILNSEDKYKELTTIVYLSGESNKFKKKSDGALVKRLNKINNILEKVINLKYQEAPHDLSREQKVTFDVIKIKHGEQKQSLCKRHSH